MGLLTTLAPVLPPLSSLNQSQMWSCGFCTSVEWGLLGSLPFSASGMGWARPAGKVGIAAGEKAANFYKLLVKQVCLGLVIAESSWEPVALAQVKEVAGNPGGGDVLSLERKGSPQSNQFK